MTNNRFDRARVGVGIACGLLLTSCAGTQQASGSDKAGGDADPVVLTMADFTSGLYYVPAVQHFVDHVAELSDGSLIVDVTSEWGDFAPDVEQLVVGDVAAGDVDLAWVGTRAFDTLGVEGLRALNAPMLIDSYRLQQAVIASDIPGEMLTELETVGVEGIAVLAEGLRKPIAVDQPLLSPADYEGIGFTAVRSTTHAASIDALGAEAGVATAGTRNEGLASGEIQGFEMNLLGYSVTELQFLAPYVTANVNLWAMPVVLIANPEALAELTETQRGWVMQAGVAATEQSTELVNTEAELLAQLCETGARFANASDADLAALREAFEPVYATLEQDTQTADFVARIEELKATTDPGPSLDVPADCAGSSPLVAPVVTSAPSDPDSGEAVSASLDGTYRWTVTEEDARANGDARLVSADFLPWYPMIATLTLADGTWELLWRGGDGAEATDGPGTYTVTGDQITLDNPADLTFTFTFSIDADGNIDVAPVLPMHEDAQFLYAHYRWDRIEGGVAEEPAAVVLDGTYRWTLTEEDALAHGTPNDQTPESLASFPWLFTVTLVDGVWTMPGECDSADCTYSVEGNRISFVWPREGRTLAFTFTADDDGTLHLLDMLPPANPGDEFVWTTKPWERID